MNIRGITAIFLGALAVAPAEAAQFYYVSAPYVVSNYDTDEPPVITAGLLEIDEALVPGGLANTQFRIDDFTTGEEREWQEINPAVKRVAFTNGEITMDRVLSNYGVSLYFDFDAEGRIASYGGVFGEEYAEGRSNDLLIFDTGHESYQGGYGTKRGHYTDSEVTGHHQTWFTDVLEWTAAVAKRTLYSVSNPPSNACRVSLNDLDTKDWALT